MATKPSLRPQGARVFARLPCPQDAARQKREVIGVIKAESREGKSRFPKPQGLKDSALTGNRVVYIDIEKGYQLAET